MQLQLKKLVKGLVNALGIDAGCRGKRARDP